MLLYDWLLLVEFALAPLVFILLLFVSAPYGKFVRSGWGPALPSWLAWLVMEAPAALLPPVFFLAVPAGQAPVTFVFLLLWELHYLRRTFVYPFLLRDKKRPFPVVVMLMAFFFNILNGFVNGYGVFARACPEAWLLDPRFFGGVALFLCGLGINIHSDAVLRSMRQPGETAHRIPERGLFRLVSNAHYLGEILEWCGWALLTWSTAGLAFALFTIANLAPRARANHRWYRETFPEYPAKRKALVPFLY